MITYLSQIINQIVILSLLLYPFLTFYNFFCNFINCIYNDLLYFIAHAIIINNNPVIIKPNIIIIKFDCFDYIWICLEFIVIGIVI